MKASEALRGLLVRLLDLGRSWSEGGVKCLCSGLGAVLDDERKVAGSVLMLQPWSSSLCEP
jgi:hypothetical protein